ncbi:SRPBCC family protein [Paraglaciecola aquimarina]|uniref:SRPBCC family protein n=1 Tax=Paraglaciecola algarum TaxID=3050085 RepID=A0ABS9D948_9ALTE|nr:SRPBCC family protein [Paraglaciecola sp. G1-23]MCF2949475.1 SRPBCC family protein [Paraglaciecola sp. G1-23]
MKITIETLVNKQLDIVWNAWITPECITKWNFASDDWCCPRAEVDLVQGGRFNYRMEAKDASMAFDFEGTFTKVIDKGYIQYELDDNRLVDIEFIATPAGVKVIESFEAEDENSAQQQRQGWLCILENFKTYVEGLTP